MGSYAQCWLGDFLVSSTKNDVDVGLLELFRPGDKVVVEDWGGNLPVKIRQSYDAPEDGEECLFVWYQASANVLRDRLNLRGYSFENCKLAFEESRKSEIESIESRYTGDLADVFAPKLAVLKALSVERWLLEIAEIRRLKIRKATRQPGDEIKDYMLSEGDYGYSGIDNSVVLRLLIETFPELDEFVYDVTELVRSGYFEVEDDFVALGIQEASESFSASAKIIVLTEGKTDSWVLSEALSLLYPHLADYYSFMDFEVSRSMGGVGHLVNLVKSFAGAGIVNRTVAIFDNDTAATAAIRSLRSTKLPKHILVMKLPCLEMLNHYPTLGPTGNAPMNVNGLAASIELMLGADVLANGGGFMPVQWTGYESSVGAYQGEVMEKALIHQRFAEKLQASKGSRDRFAEMDWNGLVAVFQSLFSAFHELDREEILWHARLN